MMPAINQRLGLRSAPAVYVSSGPVFNPAAPRTPGAARSPAPAAATVETERPGCGCFESSRELCSGLGIEDNVMELTTFALWAGRSSASASKY